MMLLDSSAVLAYLQREPGWEAVEPALLAAQACISTVNLAEAIAKLSDWGVGFETATQMLHPLALQHLPFDAALALEAARIRPLTRAQGLSLGDRACLATARQENLAVLTADRPWLALSETLGLDIRCIRPEAH